VVDEVHERTQLVVRSVEEIELLRGVMGQGTDDCNGGKMGVGYPNSYILHWFETRVGALPTTIIAYPAGVSCPNCGGVVEDWHREWTNQAQGSDFYKGLRCIDCPLCREWVLYQGQKIQAVPRGAKPQQTRRLPLQAARWAKSQSRQGRLRD